MLLYNNAYTLGCAYLYQVLQTDSVLENPSAWMLFTTHKDKLAKQVKKPL